MRFFWLKAGLGCQLVFFTPAQAVEVRDKIELPAAFKVSYCQDHPPYTDRDSYCTIGFGDSVEILDKKTLPNSSTNLFILKYSPGNGHWEGKCRPGRNLCSYQDDTLRLYQHYSSVEPEIETVMEDEKFPDNYLQYADNPTSRVKCEDACRIVKRAGFRDDNNSTSVVKGQIFSAYLARAWHLPDDILSLKSLSSLESARYTLDRLTGKECSFYYGYRLKIVGWTNNNFTVYVRLMGPEYEKQVVKYKQFFNCPAGELFIADLHELIESDMLYRESLNLREDFLKAFFSSRAGENLFDIPQTVDGLTVGQEISLPVHKFILNSIQNMDKEYLWEASESLPEQGSEKLKSFIKDLNPLVWTTIPMLNYWSCREFNARSHREESYTGRIIGFTETNLTSNPFYSSDLQWSAIVENEAFNDTHCQFILLPVSWIHDRE